MYSTPFDARSSRPAIVIAVLATMAAALLAVLPNVTANAAPAPVAKITNTAQQSSYGIWPQSTVPAVPFKAEPGSVSLGLEFSSDTGGQLLGVQYYAADANRAATTGHVWNSAGRRVAQVSFPETSTDGWKTAWLSSPVKIRAGAKYTVSYRAPDGGYAIEEDVFSDGRTRTVNGLTAHRGTYVHGTGRPTNTWHGSHYFIDVAFVPRSGSTPTPTPEPAPAPTPTPTPTGCVRPDASNTGATGTLTSYTGSSEITTDGAVIENKIINVDELRISADDVVIRNSHVTGTIYVNEHDDVTISHVTADGGILVSSGHRSVIEYTEIGNDDGDDSLHVTSDGYRSDPHIQGVTIRNNWLHSPVVPDSAHYDGLQVRGAEDVLVECNNFDLGPLQGGYNAALYLEGANGGFSNARVLNNWLLGGDFNVMFSTANDDGVILSNNKVGGDYRWDICYTGSAAAVPKEQTGNTLLNGDPVVPCP